MYLGLWAWLALRLIPSIYRCSRRLGNRHESRLLTTSFPFCFVFLYSLSPSKHYKEYSWKTSILIIALLLLYYSSWFLLDFWDLHLGQSKHLILLYTISLSTTIIICKSLKLNLTWCYIMVVYNYKICITSNKD